MDEPIVLEVFSDYSWPWCYFSTGRIERLKQEYAVKVKWIAFPLHPEIPLEGRSLEELFAGHPVDIPALMGRLKKAADDLSLPICERMKVYNSRRATELSKWAEEKGRGDGFHDAVFRAYFADGENISDIAVLKQICSRLNLDPQEAEAVLEEGSYRSAVDDDWQAARERGVQAVPTFSVAGQTVVGAQPYRELKRLVTAAKQQV